MAQGCSNSLAMGIGLYTMCDFHDFGLTFFSPYCVFVLLKVSKHVFWAVAVHSAGPFEKFQKTLILAFEANSVAIVPQNMRPKL